MTQITTTAIALLHSIVAATNGADGFMQITQTDDAMALHSNDLIEVNAGVPNLKADHVAARATPTGIQFAQSNPVQSEQPANTGWGGQPSGGQPTNFGEAHAQSQAAAQTTQEQAPASAGAAFIRIDGSGFTPAAPAKREGVSRDAPEKYDFKGLKAPTKRTDGTIDYSGATIFVPSTKHTKGEKSGQLRTPEEMAFSLQSACNAAKRRYGEVIGKDAKGRAQYKFGPEFKAAPYTHEGQPGAVIYREYKEETAATA